jgi:hypothetical protein
MRPPSRRLVGTAAWHAADEEIQAVNRHAWDSLHAAGVYHDDERRLWLQRPQAV